MRRIRAVFTASAMRPSLGQTLEPSAYSAAHLNARKKSAPS